MSKTLPLLSAAAALDGTEQMLVSQGGNPRRTTAASVAALSGATANAFAKNLLDFIPQTEWAAITAQTSTYDCYAATIAAIAALPAEGGILHVPPGIYNFSATLKLKKYVHIIGAGTGSAAGAAGTYLVWPTNTDGIVVNRHDTFVSGGSGAADGSIFEGLICGVAAGGSTSGNGIWLRARAEIRNCVFGGFGGNGIHIAASVGGNDGDGSLGNANNWFVEKCYLVGNHGSGMFVYGTDVNAGVCISVSASANNVCGIWDSSFLGNTYVGCHTEDNVVAAYRGDNPDARNVWLGCYSEGSQGQSQFLAPGLVMGGIHEAGFTSDSSAQIITSALMTPIGISKQVGSPRTFGYGVNDAGIVYSPDGGITTVQIGLWDAITGCYVDCSAYSPQFTSVLHTSASNLIRDDVSGANIGSGETIFPSKHYVRTTGQTAKQTTVTYGSAAPIGTDPVGNDWVAGDIVYNTAPTSGGYVGWVCTVAGHPGTWKTFGLIS